MALGTDFEVFVENDVGCIVPAIGMQLPGKREKHIELHDQYGLAGTVHRDNLMLEICAMPASTAAKFEYNVRRAFEAAQTWLGNNHSPLRISTNTAGWFDEDILMCPEAEELGCDEDFIAQDYDSYQRPPITVDDLGHDRFAGGHVHISYDNPQIPAWLAACMCDLFIGLPNSSRVNRDRGAHYGQCSLHRPTKYPNGDVGVEYRALDSYWVYSPENRMKVAVGADNVQWLLNSGDTDMIRELLRMRESIVHRNRRRVMDHWGDQDTQECVHRSKLLLTEARKAQAS